MVERAHPAGSPRAAPPAVVASPLAAIRGNPLLRSLPGAALSRLLPQIEQVDFGPGEQVAGQGNAADALLLVVDGTVELLRDGAPRAEALGPGALVGQEAAGLAAYALTARAASAVRAWRIPRAAVRELCAAVPQLEARLVHSLHDAPAPGDAGRPAGRAAPPPPEPTARALVGWGTALVLPPAVFVLVHALGLGLHAAIFLAIVAVVITMWVFTLVDDFIPPLLALACLMFVGIAPPTVVLSSFASPSFFTLLGVFALAAMLTGSGLSKRVLLGLVSRLPDRPAWHQATMLIYGLVLSLATPSGNNRMGLMLPAFRELSHGLRLPAKGAAATALFAATYGGAMLFSSAFATSKSVTISVLGFLPFHLQSFYAGLFWMGAAAVSTGVLLLFHVAGARLMFRPARSGSVSRELLADQLALLGPMSLAEKVTVGAFLMFLVGSLTTSVHHVAPSALAGAVLAGLLVTGAMTKIDFQKTIDWPMIVFLVSADCLVRVMDYLGLSAQLAEALRPFGHLIRGDVVVFLAVALIAVLAVRLLLPIPAAMLLSAVVLLPIAQSEGINPWICIFAIAVFSDTWFFRYQNSIYMIAVNGGGVAMIDEAAFMRHNMVMNVARVAGVFASLPLWRWMDLA